MALNKFPCFVKFWYFYLMYTIGCIVPYLIYYCFFVTHVNASGQVVQDGAVGLLTIIIIVFFYSPVASILALIFYLTGINKKALNSRFEALILGLLFLPIWLMTDVAPIAKFLSDWMPILIFPIITLTILLIQGVAIHHTRQSKQSHITDSFKKI